MIRKLEDLIPFAPIVNADHFGVYICPDCNSAHVVLFDRDSTPIAQMTMGPDQLRTLKNAATEVFIEKGVL